MNSAYPTAFSDIRRWATQNGIDVNEGRIRFAQYAILRAIANSRRLSDMLVFKGGNALDFIWQPNRSTRDLDFSADMAFVGPDWDPLKFGDLLKGAFEASLKIVTEQTGIVFAIHNVTKQPPGPDKTFVTFEVRVGYALPDQAPLIARMSHGGRSPHVIPVEISLNEPICADQGIDVQATHRLRVSTVEDVVAEKLRALLQQPIRNRRRRQDLLDIAILVRERPDLDRPRIVEFLLRKSAERDVPVSRSAFHNPEVAQRASYDYAELRQTTRKVFIPFEEALHSLLDFIDTLPFPEASPEAS
jgi:predicted nucleotidyltransferase component of viral defense system